MSPAITGDLLRLNAPGMPALELPLQPKPAVLTRVTVWRDSCEATWTGEPAARWFSDFLGIPCSLVHMPADSWLALGQTDFGKLLSIRPVPG